MKIFSILLIGIASLGVVVEFKSDKTVIDSIPNYVVIVVFYLWAYLAQKYSEIGYKGGVKSILGTFLFGFGIVGLVNILFSEVSYLSFSENVILVISFLILIFVTSILLIISGHKRHVKLAVEWVTHDK